MRVVVAPDSFGGTLSAPAAARAIAAGWTRARPDDDVQQVPLADGGEGALDVLAAVGGRVHEVEVAGPHGRPVGARWLDRGAQGAFVETAEACGLRHLAPQERDPRRTTTYGVGQLLLAALASGAPRIVVGLGGSATVDGGAGALTALGLRLLRADGNGLKVGGGELVELAHVEPGWLDGRWSDRTIELWSDVRTPLRDAAEVFGPQKGATPDDVALLARGLRTLAGVLEADLGVPESLRAEPGTGAAGGLGYGLAATLRAPLHDGAAGIADAVGLAAAIEGADLVVVGEGRLDRTSLQGKVVGHVLERAQAAGVPVLGVVGQAAEDVGFEVVEAAPDGPGDDPDAEVARAAEALARTQR